MSPSHVLPAASVTRQRRRFRSCSIDITAYRLAGTEQLDALTAAKGKRTFDRSVEMLNAELFSNVGLDEGELDQLVGLVEKIRAAEGDIVAVKRPKPA